MKGNMEISNFLSTVLQDWRSSRTEFPRNVYPASHWPIPFFGNPATAVVATVGVNPSSGEFHNSRGWRNVRSDADWKRRLKNYFNNRIPAHTWFAPWRAGLELLDRSYEVGTAAHLDVSFRPTLAMLRNPRIDPLEFRRMLERDVVWFFRLLPLCTRLRVLLVFGPIIRANGSKESLVSFVRSQAPRHGFKILPNGNLQQSGTKKMLMIHEADARTEESVTNRVIKNILAHREELRRAAWSLD